MEIQASQYKPVLVIESMPKRDRTLPTRIWRIAERQTNHRGMISEGWKLVRRDLTLAGAKHELKLQRSIPKVDVSSGLTLIVRHGGRIR